MKSAILQVELKNYTIEELLLIYFNQGKSVALRNPLSLECFYDEYGDYSNYDNYNNYDDYHNYNDYHNYDQYNSGCFITTAVCGTFGKPDDCEELMAFRKFRDSFMMTNDCLKKDVERYYEIAPQICRMIEAKGVAYAEKKYTWIWNTFLSQAFSALKSKEYERTYSIYKDMVMRLEKEFI